MMLVRSPTLMPSSAPAIFSLSVGNQTRLPSPRRGVTGSGTATQNAGETMDVTRFFGNATYQGYGQTEVLPIAMMRRECGSPRMRPGLQPLPFAELQIRDEDNN